MITSDTSQISQRVESQIHFVTYFTKEYAIYGLCLIDSLRTHHVDSLVIVYCLDHASLALLNQHYDRVENIIVEYNSILVEEIHSFRNKGRTLPQSIWSVKPAMILDSMKYLKDSELLFFSDADIMFFGRFELEQSLEYNVFVSRHILATRNLGHEKYGMYNAGFVGFRKNFDGISVLNWWNERCIENCRFDEELGLADDQKYLEEFSKVSNKVYEVSDLRINQSLWSFDPKLNQKELAFLQRNDFVCFHFHGLRATRAGVRTSINRYGKIKNRKKIFQIFYRPYIALLSKQLSICTEFLPEFSPSVRDRLKKFEFVTWENQKS